MTITQILSEDNMNSKLHELLELIIARAQAHPELSEDAVYQYTLEYLYENERSTLAMLLYEFEKGKTYVGPVIAFGAAEIVFDSTGTEVSRRPLLPLADMNVGRNNQHPITISFRHVVKDLLDMLRGSILDRAFADRHVPA